MANKKCPVAKKCSGCQLSNMTYEQQLEWKQKDTEKLLGSFGKVSEIIGADDPYNYRNKVQAVFRSDRNGRIISGVYQSSRNGIVGIDSCMLDDKRADEIIVGIRELLRSFKLHPYDEGTERGFLRHVLVRVGKKTGEILVTLVGGNSMFPKKHDFVKALVKRFPDITTVTFSVNRTPEMLLLGENNEVLYGKGKEYADYYLGKNKAVLSDDDEKYSAGYTITADTSLVREYDDDEVKAYTSSLTSGQKAAYEHFGISANDISAVAEVKTVKVLSGVGDKDAIAQKNVEFAEHPEIITLVKIGHQWYVDFTADID